MANKKKWFCIEVQRELEDMDVLHVSFEHTPMREEVLAAILEELPSYDDDYGKFTFYEIGDV